MTSAIKVEGIGKKYVIRHEERARYETLRDVIAEGVRRVAGTMGAPFSAGSSTGKERLQKKEDFWALKDVSFEIGQGETVGIIGRNGAGKSTLLKILSRITEPTAGRVKLKGRVASLLEVGTGFHPELTGRENVFLNGAILGMTKVEIRKKFDEIVAFAEIERFLDTPVKRYSSGMYVRLAFAVAAHLEPEILLVDEVLAVGDNQFQKKCLGRMGSAAREGRTIIFVSHNMAAVSTMCSRTILLQNGRIAGDGASDRVIAQYQESSTGNREPFVDLTTRPDRYGPGHLARFKSAALFDMNGSPCRSISMGEGMGIQLVVSFLSPTRAPEVGLAISNMLGHRVTHMVSVWEGLTTPANEGDYVYQVEIPRLSLVPGLYTITVWLKNEGKAVNGSDDGIEGALNFEVTQPPQKDNLPYFEAYCRPGEVYMENHWSVREVQ